MGRERLSPDSASRNPLGHKRGLLFSANFVPFDPQKEGPTPEDRKHARTIKGELKGQKGAVSVPVAAGLTGVALVAGGVGGFFLRDVVAAESISELTPASRDIGSVPGGTSFTDDRPVDDRLVSTDNKFDNNAEEGTISSKNWLRITEEDVNTLPTVDENGDPLYPMPLIFDSTEDIKYEYVEEWDGINGGRIRLYDVKAGTPVMLRRTWGNGSVFTGAKEIGDSTPAGITSRISVTSTPPDGNSYIFVVATDFAANKTPNSLKVINQIPPRGGENSSGRDLSKGLQLENEYQIVGIVNENANIVELQLGVRTPAFMRGEDAKGIIRKKLNLVAKEDDSGTTKLVIIEPQR